MGLALLVGAVLVLGACGDEDITAVPEGSVPTALLPFEEDFSDNAQGWSLGPEWEIGPAVASGYDPGVDTTPTGDNGVAGVVIGGDYGLTLHPYYFLTSPVLRADAVAGSLSLQFQRWLTSDYPPYATNIVQVWDGGTWQTVWQQPDNGTFIADSAWTPFTFDITAHANPALRVRFGFKIEDSGVIARGGWNIDDVRVAAP